MKVGKGVRAATAGGETVQYRHEKTFFNPSLLGALVGSDIADADLETKLNTWNAFQFERVGLNLRPELIALKDVNGDKDGFAKTAKKIADTSEFNLILMTEDADVMKAGIEACGFKRPLVYAATEANVDAYGALAKEVGVGREAARDVGEAMARNPTPLIIPCHRVLAAGGKIGGF